MTPDQRAAQKASTEAQARVKRENAAHTPGPWQLLPEEAGKDYLRIRGTQLGGRYKVANVLAWCARACPRSAAAKLQRALQTRASSPPRLSCWMRSKRALAFVLAKSPPKAA